jgi:WD40 repeat protein
MAFNFLKNLDADDIFISYSREDGSAYLTGLDAALSARGFSCFTDKRGTDAGRLPPETLFRKIRLCKTLVLLGTPGAVESPENITPELKEFAEANGTARIIWVTFDRDAELSDCTQSPWFNYVEGKSRELEDANALKTGTPSEAVVTAVAAASHYMKSKDRLRMYRNRAIGVLGMLVVAIAIAAMIAFVMVKRATAATAAAAAATIEATRATQEAKNARALAQTAKADADSAKADATEQKRLAEEAVEDAKEKTRLAEAAGLRAQQAEAHATVEQARAEREQAIGEARSLGNRARTILRQNPQNVSGSLQKAVEAMNKSASAGVHSLEADTALRESLALFPRRQCSYVYAEGDEYDDVEVTALSPDGRRFASVSKRDGKLLVYESGNETTLGEFDCKCSKVALSSEPAYAAAVTDKGVVRIFNLADRQDREGRALQLPPGVSPEHIALSPGGRYLVLSADLGKDGNRHSALLVLEVADGSVVKAFDNYNDASPEGGGAGASSRGVPPAGQAEDMASASCDNLDMLINDVAFGPGGDLAVGGRSDSLKDKLNEGRVVIWSLRLKQPDTKSEPTLTGASFDDREVVPQKDQVKVVALGWDSTLFATENGVWKRMSDNTGYESVSRLPELREGTEEFRARLEVGMENFTKKKFTKLRIFSRYEYDSFTVSDLAFGPDDGSLSVFRNETQLERVTLEVWDATGHRESARTSLERGVRAIGFGPGGRFVVVEKEPPPPGKIRLRVSGREVTAEVGVAPETVKFRVFRTDDATEVDAPPVKLGKEDGRVIYFSPYTDHLVTLKDKVAVVWDVLKKRRWQTVPFGARLGSVKTVALSPDAEYLALTGPVAGGDAQTLVVYRADGETFREWKRLPPELFDITFPAMTEFGERPVSATPVRVSLSAGGRVIAAAYPRPSLSYPGAVVVRIFDVVAGRDVTPESAGQIINIPYVDAWDEYLTSVSPCGRYVAVASGHGRALLINLSTGRADELFEEASVSRLAFSPNGRHLGLGTNDGTLHVFDTARPDDEIATLQHTGEITAFGFSNDGKYVVTASDDPDSRGPDKKGSYPLRVWLLRPKELLAEADARMSSLLAKPLPQVCRRAP